MKSDSGFTLVELLISMTILSMTVLLSGVAFQQFTSSWSSSLSKFDSEFEVLRRQWLFRQATEKIHPFLVRNSNGSPRFYFEGNRNGFVAVTAESLSSSFRAGVIRMSLIQKASDEFDLVMEEAPFFTEDLVITTQNLQFSSPVLLISGLKSPEFEYFGPPELRLDADTDLEVPRRWFSSYNSLQTMVHPSKIRFSWVEKGRRVSWETELLQPAPGRMGAFRRPEEEI